MINTKYMLESIIKSSDLLLEFFGRKKKPEPEPIKKKEYDGNNVRADVKKILTEVGKWMRTDSNLKKYNNNGMEVCKNDIYDLCSGSDSEVYLADEDEFCLINIDLWDYKGGNPRQIIDESPDGWHPIDYAQSYFRSKLEKFLESKYPDFYVAEYGGDWDTGTISIALKNN